MQYIVANKSWTPCHLVVSCNLSILVENRGMDLMKTPSMETLLVRK